MIDYLDAEGAVDDTSSQPADQTTPTTQSGSYFDTMTFGNKARMPDLDKLARRADANLPEERKRATAMLAGFIQHHGL